MIDALVKELFLLQTLGMIGAVVEIFVAGEGKKNGLGQGGDAVGQSS